MECRTAVLVEKIKRMRSFSTSYLVGRLNGVERERYGHCQSSPVERVEASKRITINMACMMERPEKNPSMATRLDLN